MKPNLANYCSGAFQDWLEVMLTPQCNANCPWCVEKGGYRPREIAPVAELIKTIQLAEETNIHLLGGEPLLYDHLGELIAGISSSKKVFITTNGALLTPERIANLVGIAGLNVSIHHYNLSRNAEIVGCTISGHQFQASVREASANGICVRFNCNIIGGFIDSRSLVEHYAAWAGGMGASSVRYAELKNDASRFVSLGQILDYEYGLNENPFAMGCNRSGVLNGMPVNFRQMCGLQTPVRPMPDNPDGASHRVLYYDGMFYAGWQREKDMVQQNNRELEAKIRKLEKEIEILKKQLEVSTQAFASGGGCMY